MEGKHVNREDWFRSQFRIPPDLHEMLKQSTEKTGRSMNSEIVERLRASFEDMKFDHNVIDIVRRTAYETAESTALAVLKQLGKAT